MRFASIVVIAAALLYWVLGPNHPSPVPVAKTLQGRRRHARSNHTPELPRICGRTRSSRLRITSTTRILSSTTARPAIFPTLISKISPRFVSDFSPRSMTTRTRSVARACSMALRWQSMRPMPRGVMEASRSASSRTTTTTTGRTANRGNSGCFQRFRDLGSGFERCRPHDL